jgi:hypothetical protein
MYRARWEKIKQRIDNLPPAVQRGRGLWLAPISTPRTIVSMRRKRRGITCIYTTITPEMVDSLCKLAILQPEQRSSRDAIRNAVEAHLHTSLVEKYKAQLWTKIAAEQRQQELYWAKHNRKNP